MTQIRTAYLFLGEWLSLPFIFVVHEVVPWVIKGRQPLCTLKDCSQDVRHGTDSAFDENHISSEVTGEKVGRKYTSYCSDAKKQVTKECLEQKDKCFLRTTLLPGPQM